MTYLNFPVQSKNLQRCGNQVWKVGFAEMQGFRDDMQDAHQVVLQLPRHPSLTYVGMFDGHRGTAASEWMAREMSGRIDALENPTDPASLTRCIEQADADFLSDPARRKDGTTANMVLIDCTDPSARRLTIANVGDSRCIVFGPDGQVKLTTRDHKPELPQEAARIEAAGGEVKHGRVDGLNMSRSIGDATRKDEPALPLTQQKVIPTPDVKSIVLQPDDLLLVCCDGLLEDLSNAQLCQFLAAGVAQARQQGRSVDPARLVAQLMDHSLKAGSKDNMSACLLLQEDGSAFANVDDEYELGPFGVYQHDAQFVAAYFEDAAKHGIGREELMRRVAQAEQQAVLAQSSSDTVGAASAPAPAPASLNSASAPMIAMAKGASVAIGPGAVLSSLASSKTSDAAAQLAADAAQHGVSMEVDGEKQL